MPWHKKTKKDATTCEKRWGAGRKLWSVDVRMGQPGMSHIMSSYTEYIGVVKEYLGNWNILVPRGKERFNLIPSVAASESGGAQTNLRVGVTDHIIDENIPVE